MIKEFSEGGGSVGPSSLFPVTTIQCLVEENANGADEVSPPRGLKEREGGGKGERERERNR